MTFSVDFGVSRVCSTGRPSNSSSSQYSNEVLEGLGGRSESREDWIGIGWESGSGSGSE